MRKIVFLTGTGIPVESDFKTFHDNGGLWEDYPVEQVAAREGWVTNPTLISNFCNNLRKELCTAKPNGGRRPIKELEEDYDMTVITQDVDDLHEKTGSLKIIYLHEELTKVCSSKIPYDGRCIQELPKDSCRVAPGTLAKDGSLLRPFIIFFSESIPMIEPAAEVVAQADILIIIGTSLVVYPAVGLMQYTRPGTPIYLVDLDDTPIHASGRLTHIKKGVSEDMKELIKLL